MSLRRGEICWVNFEPSSPPEFGKTRPAVIVSNSEQNSVLPTVVVIPLSSRPPDIWPLRVEITLVNKKRSYAVIPGIRQVSKSRIFRSAGLLSKREIVNLSSALETYLKD